MPSLLLAESNTPSALMAIPLDSPKRPFSRLEDPSPTRGGANGSDDPYTRPAVRMKAPLRPRSSIQILEDFNENDQGPPSAISESPNPSQFSTRLDGSSFILDEREEDATNEASGTSILPKIASVPPSPRREDTARRHKRFSLPALALQTTPVTARPNIVGEGKSKRFSLVLGKSGMSSAPLSGELGGSSTHGIAVGKLNELLGRR